jgi:hypothetical protein
MAVSSTSSVPLYSLRALCTGWGISNQLFQIATTLPLTRARGTGPYILESREAARLSPTVQQCPTGTCCRSCQHSLRAIQKCILTCIMVPSPLPGVSLSTKSPGIPITLLMVVSSPCMGCLYDTMSPTCMPRPRRYHLETTTLVPLAFRVGSIEGPHVPVQL